MGQFLRALTLAVAAAEAAALDGPPNFHACVSDVAKKLPYCDQSLSVEKRLDDLMSRCTKDETNYLITLWGNEKGPHELPN